MSNDLMLYSITALYAVCNLARLLAYAPQIAAVARDHSGAFSISLLSWTMWATTYAVTVVYSALVIRDALLTTMMIGNTIGATLIVLVAVQKRREFAERRLMAPVAASAVS